MPADRQQDISWYRITIVRAASLATLIMVAGYIASLITVREVNESLAKLAYDVEVEYSLTDYLSQIKENDQLKRDYLALELKQQIKSSPKTSVDLRNLLVRYGIEEVSAASELTIEKQTISSNEKDIVWLSRTQLKVFDWVIYAPASEARQKFEYSQAIWQRYQLIRSTWNDHIGPTFVAIHGLILAGSFAVLGLSLFLMARRYRKRIKNLLHGFVVWSDKDSNFRFPVDQKLHDELTEIESQFNTMAAEVEMNRQRRAYLEKISSWQTIARKLAHEIKNPLTPIQMMVSHLDRSYSGEDEKYRNLIGETTRIVNEEIKSLRRMVDNFSNFAQMPTAKIESGNLMEVIQHVYELQKVTFPNHSFKIDSDQDQAVCSFDPHLMRQVILNLTKNAAELQHEGLEIELRLRSTPKNFVIEVHDNGPGIKEEDLNRIFEAYFTTKHTGDNPGMGLGLAICKKIMIDHGGELRVDSKTGDTTFTMILPKKDD